MTSITSTTSLTKFISGLSANQLGGVFKIDWISKEELPFQAVHHLTNSWNEDKPVKIGRDGQEIEPSESISTTKSRMKFDLSHFSAVAQDLCRLFPKDASVDMTPILRRSKESARLQRAKPEEERRRAIPTSQPLSANRGGPPPRPPLERGRGVKRRNDDHNRYPSDYKYSRSDYGSRREAVPLFDRPRSERAPRPGPRDGPRGGVDKTRSYYEAVHGYPRTSRGSDRRDLSSRLGIRDRDDRLRDTYYASSRRPRYRDYR